MLAENFVEEPPSKIVIALQFWAGDQGRAMRLARLLADIEPRRRDDVIFAFCRRFDVPMSREVWDAALHVGGKFPVIHLASQREAVNHPDGCYGLFAGTMDHLSKGWASGSLHAHSAFTIEADGVPLRRDWLDIVLAEHRRTIEGGKRVTGAADEQPGASPERIDGSAPVDLAGSPVASPVPTQSSVGPHARGGPDVGGAADQLDQEPLRGMRVVA